MKPSSPPRREEIERYLASGLIKGIGEMTAKAIVETLATRH